MRILVHICCGPCAITVLQRLIDAGHSPVGFFFNPNIQPLAEYLRRREGAIQVTERLSVPLVLADTLAVEEQAWAASDPFLGAHEEGGGGTKNYSATAFHVPLPDLPPAVNPVAWLRAVSGQEDRRCLFCWGVRLRKTAQFARSNGFEGFSTSLLYSRYQDHERIRGIGDALAEAQNLSFMYEDFRTSWQQGITLSKEWGIYRQQYCGCIYSEYDRYARDCRRLCGV